MRRSDTRNRGGRRATGALLRAPARAVNAVLGLLGLRLGRVPRAERQGSAHALAADAIAIVRPYTMLSDARLASLYDQVRHCERVGIEGSYVECGVWKGGASALMAAGNLTFGAKRRSIHLFDAFDDICEPDPTLDGERALREARDWAGKREVRGSLEPMAGFYSHKGGPGTIEDARRVMQDVVGYPQKHVTYHQGWFQHTVPSGAPDTAPIAILRLDGDWHASTEVCLHHLYDAVVPGGFIIVDDYGTYEGCRKAVDDFRSERSISEYLSYVDSECCYWIKDRSPRGAGGAGRRDS